MVLTALKPIEQTATTPVTFLPRQAYALVDGKRVPVRVLGSLDDSQVRVEVLDAHGGSGRFVEVPQAGILKKIAPRWENFGNAITAMGYFPRYLRNTLVLCMLTVVGTVLSSATVAYGFSRVDWPGRDRVFILLLATMMVPFPVVMVPLYSMFRAMGWIGTLRPLWVPAFFASAFNVFLLRQFFMQLPRDLSESARLDGASELRIFVSIILPLSKPVLVVVALFQFLATWNDFLGPLIYLTDQKDFTLALGLQFFQSQHGGTQWHLLMAAATLVAGPVIVLYFFAQKFFVRGIAMTGLKA
ncbi:MAG: ABC transporter permease subunit [Phycisphaera sp.]|nr:ABC transporter permease subunit [Phycisphaera sp.]